MLNIKISFFNEIRAKIILFSARVEFAGFPIKMPNLRERGVLSMMEDKFHLTKDQNRRYARSNLVRLVHVNSRFEGVNTTLWQTQAIIDGLDVDGVSIDDINVIVQLKQAWQYIINADRPMDLAFLKSINKLVALHDALEPGELRTGNGAVNTELGEYVPDDVILPKEEEFITALVHDSHKSTTDEALTLMYHLMRSQIFWDGNKRTATLAANKLMIDGGAGIINVPLDKWPKWNELISRYYFSNDMTAIKKWTYQNGM